MADGGGSWHGGPSSTTHSASGADEADIALVSPRSSHNRHSGATTTSPLSASHRIASFYEISQLNGPYDLLDEAPDEEPLIGADGSHETQPARALTGPDSLSHAVDSSPWSSSTGYAPVPTSTYRQTDTQTTQTTQTTLVTPSRTMSRTKLLHKLSLSRKKHDAIVEEDGFSMSLIRSAAPISGAEGSTAVNLQPPPAPSAQPWDELFLKTMQEQEAKGELSGGLGMGLKVDATVREQDLLDDYRQLDDAAHAPLAPAQPQTIWQRTLSRQGFGKPTKPLDRRDTIRGLGQNEADRRGQVIEVVAEDDDDDDKSTTLWQGTMRTNGSSMDVSFMAGPATLSPSASSANSLQTNATKPAQIKKKNRRVEVFYPKGNWKPWSMRAPYLTALIILSLTMALCQEILFQRFHEKPVVQFTHPSEIGSARYFAVKFLPTILSVAYGVLWQITDFEMMRLEAFYQLSRPGGALAGQSINVDYVTTLSVLRPLQALRLGHYAVAVSSMATTLAVSLVPTFGAASLYLSPDRAARLADPGLVKSMHVRETWSRLLSTTLLLCAIFASVLLFLLQTRKSGLLADVRGIAGLASMAVASHILTDFRGLDTVQPEVIHDTLKQKRYLLQSASLVPVDSGGGLPEKQQQQQQQQKKKKKKQQQPPSTSTSLQPKPTTPDNPHPLMLRPAGCAPFIVSLVLFAAFVPVFLFTPATDIGDKAPFVVTALAVFIKMTWGAMETAVRMMEPYYILSRRHAPPYTLTLDYAAIPFGELALKALFNGHTLMCLVGFGTVMAEFLTVLAASLSTVDGRDFVRPVLELAGAGVARSKQADDAINAGSETAATFLIAFSLVMFILVYMIVVATVVFLRRRHAFLPRQPNTIASVLAFIHQSRMLWDFVDTARLGHGAMERHLAAVGKTYGLGWYRGRDGQMHCGVDEEELTLAYRHGVDFAEGNMPWNSQWDVL